MSQLITKKMYKPFKGESVPRQIFKNKGYISIALHSALYNMSSNFWQEMFGGVNDMALTSTFYYKKENQEEDVARAVLDKRIVKTGQPIPLSIYRSLATKVPMTVDALRLEVTLIATKKDNLGHALELMTSDDFQIPFELGPYAMGQIFSTAKVIKKILSGIDANSKARADYGGVISDEKDLSSGGDEQFFEGYLILLVDEGNEFLATLDEDKISVENDGLAYEGQQLQCTNLVYKVEFHSLRGEDQDSNWFGKFAKAYDHLFDILMVSTEEDKKKIRKDALQLFIEGAALLSADPRYLEKERRDIKNRHLKDILARYEELAGRSSQEILQPLLDASLVDTAFIPAGLRTNIDEVYAGIQKEAESYEAALKAQDLA